MAFNRERSVESAMEALEGSLDYKALNLTKEQVLQLTRNAFQSAWITQDEIDDYLAALHAYVR